MKINFGKVKEKNFEKIMPQKLWLGLVPKQIDR